jgi:hypothetical protein
MVSNFDEGQQAASFRLEWRWKEVRAWWRRRLTG